MTYPMFLAARAPSYRLHLRVTRNRALAGLILLNVLDVVTTLFALTMGGGKEANPLMAPVAGNPWALVVTKLVVITMFVIAVRRAPLRRGHAASLFACGLYTTVVVSNILTIGRLTGTL